MPLSSRDERLSVKGIRMVRGSFHKSNIKSRSKSSGNSQSKSKFGNRKCCYCKKPDHYIKKKKIKKKKMRKKRV